MLKHALTICISIMVLLLSETDALSIEMAVTDACQSDEQCLVWVSEAEALLMKEQLRTAIKSYTKIYEKSKHPTHLNVLCDTKNRLYNKLSDSIELDEKIEALREAKECYDSYINIKKLGKDRYKEATPIITVLESRLIILEKEWRKIQQERSDKAAIQRRKYLPYFIAASASILTISSLVAGICFYRFSQSTDNVAHVRFAVSF